MNKVLKVALENISYSADILYSYKPSGNFNFEIGQRVIVPFGKYNTKKQGIILAVDECSDDEYNKLKQIFAIVDKNSLIDYSGVQLIEYMKNKYFCTYYDAARLVLPPGCGSGIKGVKYRIAKDIDVEKFSRNEIEFFNLIKTNCKNIISLNKIVALKFPHYNDIIFSFLEKKVMEEVLDFDKLVSKNKVSLFSVVGGLNCFDHLKSDKQKIVCEFLAKNPKSTLRAIKYYTGASGSVVNTLIKNGVLYSDKISEHNEENVADYEKQGQVSLEIVLNDEQEYAYKSIINSKKNISLLYGVTGSGKTAVLMKLIDKVLSEGQNIIFMVPEIALTSQFINLFKSKYGNDVEVLHGSLKDSQRYEIWQKIRAEKVKLVVGTRSAVFAPFQKVGLIIIDEEHEFTYKSDYPPTYDAREIAVYRCRHSGGKVVFSSATPSVESYYCAETGKYNLCKLDNRYGSNSLPSVKIINMSNQYIGGNVSLFSEALIKELECVIANGQQAILLMNRRGFNSFVKCSECSEVLTCPNCSVSLNYHKTNDRLMCHCCGYSSGVVKICPSCHRQSLVYLGVGTQKVEDILSEKLPSAKILRLDSDVKNCKNSLENDIEKFKQGDYNILIGTQMVAKGFNFPGVTLVGIISADNFLYDSDFRSSEKTFSLITQVVGRAGRTGGKGKAIVQTLAPEHEVIQLSAKQDYANFYKNELAVRKIMLNPPFCDICVINFSGRIEKKVVDVAKEFLILLKGIASKNYSSIPLRIYAPVEARIKILSKNYRYKIMIKCKNNVEFRKFINEVLTQFYKAHKSKCVSIWPVINPDMTL